jgi:SH3 domain-containing YSC84-like protein 1
MKNGCCLIFLVMAVLLPASVPGQPQELENRLSECARTLSDMMKAPDGRIPADLLKRSRAIIIFPSVIKAGLGLGGHYGKGVVLRRNSSSGRWGPPAFLTLIGGSFGWQIGVQSTNLILLVMSDVSLKSLFRDKFTIGADASVAAGPIGRDTSAGTDIGFSAALLSYSQTKGIYAGISIQGSVLEADWEANEAYYGSDLSIIDIFFQDSGKISPAGTNLIQVLNKFTS